MIVIVPAVPVNLLLNEGNDVMLPVDLLLYVALLIALLFLVVTCFWKAISNNSFGCRVARLLTTTALTAIQVGLLTVHCLTGESHGFDLFMVFIWLFCVVISAFAMRNKKRRT